MERDLAMTNFVVQALGSIFGWHTFGHLSMIHSVDNVKKYLHKKLRRT